MRTNNDSAMITVVHEFNKSHYRTTPVWVDGIGAKLIDAPSTGDWLIEIANGDRKRVAPSAVLITLGR